MITTKFSKHATPIYEAQIYDSYEEIVEDIKTGWLKKEYVLYAINMAILGERIKLALKLRTKKK